MAHVQKNNKVATGHLFDHYGRNSIDEQYKYVYRSNDSINPERTHLNYNLAPNDISQSERLNKRLSEVKVLKRKDVNVICSWVVTAPKDLNSNLEKEFFKHTYEFLNNRYGKKNVISAYVHLDETTPHLHYVFVPVTLDKKKGIEKVSAKEVITKVDLKSFHQDLDKYLMSKGIECSVLNELTKEGNKSIKELKKGSAIESLKNALNELERANKDINDLKDHKNSLEEEIKGLKGKVLTLQEINKIQVKKTFTGALRGISYDDIVNLKRTALYVDTAFEMERNFKSTKEILEKQAKTLEDGFNELEKQKDKKSVRENLNKIKTENKIRELMRYKEIFEQLPKELQHQLMKTNKSRNFEK